MTDEKLLEKYGWSLDCESPLEVSHKDGSFARHLPAELLIDHLKEVYEEEMEEERKSKSNAISPEDIDTNMESIIPKYVTDAVNTLIKKNYRGSSFTIKQKEIVAEIQKKKSVTSQFLFENNYLDFEDIYRNRGWDVEYDKPAYCETYDAYFKFTPKKK
jgi:hypothetical protein